MRSIRLQNYKCFEDTGDVELRPLNFLVGSNSSGKSSFLEFFPLLQQSMKINRDGAFLWVGNNVDINDFETAVRHGEDFIAAEFDIGRIPIYESRQKPTFYLEDVKVRIEITSSSIFSNDSISLIEIAFNGQLVRMRLNEVGNDAIEINGEKMIHEGDDVFHVPNNGLISSLVFDARIMEQRPSKYVRELTEWFKGNLNGADRIMPSFMFYRPRYSFDRKLFNSILNRQLKQGANKDEMNHIYNLSLLVNINDLIDLINYYMIELSDRIEFVQPLRANAERYYRKRNISVNRISPNGDNLAMFFLRLKKEMRLENFNSWLNDFNYDFNVDLNEEGGVVEMNIIETGKKGRNMVDVGFGYSQILPILATIWMEIFYDGRPYSRTRYCSTNMILIEQPELHLHPRFQVKFSDMLAKCIQQAAEEEKDIKFIIETHSQDIINNIGRKIAYKELDPELVNIYIFNAQIENMNNYIEKAGFTEEGFLDNWPIGFFS